MIAGLRTGGELRRFKRSKMGKIAVAAIVLIPLLYSALYLWAFWDPFSNLTKLPVAFVNDDEPTELDGERIAAGEEIVKGLADQDQIRFDYVDYDTAHRGVQNGDYYFMVRLGPEFSKAAASVSTGEARQAVIETEYNSANGYLSTMIGENVMRTLVPTISNELGSQVVDKLFMGIQDAGTGLVAAADGASKLHDGAAALQSGLSDAADGISALDDGLGTATSGADQLAAGAGQLNSSAAELAAGANQVSAGATELNNQVQTAAGQLRELTGGVAQLAGGVDQLGAGAAEISNGVGQLQDKLSQVTNAQAGAAAEMDKLAAQLGASPIAEVRQAGEQLRAAAERTRAEGLGPESQPVADINRLAQGTAELSRQLNDPTAEFRGGFEQLRTGTGELPDKLKALTDGTAQLADGAGQVAQGATKLHDDGTALLADKTGELHEGLIKLSDGAGQLNAKMPEALTGITALSDGTGELSDKLTEGAGAVPVLSAAQRAQTVDVVSDPSTLVADDEAGIQTFGSGLAPFFFSLAMFIGGMITFLLLRPMHARAVAAGVSPLRAALDGLWPGAIIGMLQSSAIVAVTYWAVGLDAAHPVLLWLFCMLVSVMFVAINQMLNVALGPGPGKVAAMALLMFQILSSNGLYPVETEPRLFSWLHPINPMTHSINGFRQLMYGNFDHRLIQAVAAVLIITALCLAVTSLCARSHRTWTMKRLHPPIAV